MSVSSQFRIQLETLLETLQGTAPHYIMCYKPNTTAMPNMLDRSLLLQQLQYSGALEVVKIRQKGLVLMKHSFFIFIILYFIYCMYNESYSYCTAIFILYTILCIILHYILILLYSVSLLDSQYP